MVRLPVAVLRACEMRERSPTSPFAFVSFTAVSHTHLAFPLALLEPHPLPLFPLCVRPAAGAPAVSSRLAAGACLALAAPHTHKTVYSQERVDKPRGGGRCPLVRSSGGRSPSRGRRRARGPRARVCRPCTHAAAEQRATECTAGRALCLSKRPKSKVASIRANTWCNTST
jgi:hypothetical protein